MKFLIEIAYLFGSLAIGIYVYYWSSTFKKIGESTIEEMNDDGIEEERVDESEAKFVNYFGSISFSIIGIIIWSILGITIGKVASEITDIKILKWIAYILFYFFFLRFPFGVGNRLIKKAYDFSKFPEKNLFAIIMLVSYIASICCYEFIPKIMKWHLVFLN